MQKVHFLCSSRKWRSIIRNARYWIVKHIKYKLHNNRYKEEKGANCSMRKYSILSAGGQCCANRGPERSCAETNSSTSCYTNSGSNSNLNNRMDDVLRPAVNNNEIECSIPGPNTETNANNHNNSNFNNRPDNTPLSSNNEIKYFLPGQAKRVTKKQALK